MKIKKYDKIFVLTEAIIEKPEIDSQLFVRTKYDLPNNDADLTREFETSEELKHHLETKFKNHIIKPIYIYDHSGVMISTVPFTSKWDSYFAGFIVLKRTYNYKAPDEHIVGMNVDMINHYLNGSATYVEITDLEGNFINDLHYKKTVEETAKIMEIDDGEYLIE